MSLDDYSSGELLDELDRRGDMPRQVKANYGMCGTCRKWAAYMGAYDADGHTLRCHGCLAPSAAAPAADRPRGAEVTDQPYQGEQAATTVDAEPTPPRRTDDRQNHDLARETVDLGADPAQRDPAMAVGRSRLAHDRRPARDGLVDLPVAEHLCVVCGRRQYERAQVCEPDREHVPDTLDAIVDLYDVLGDVLVPQRGIGGERVAGGSVEAAMPIRADVIDLAAPARPATRTLAARGALGLDPDQIGHLSVQTMLHTWITDWSRLRRQGEQPPHTVYAMTRWLDGRWEWACDHHPRVDEYVAELREFERTLRGVTGVDADDTVPIGRCQGRGNPCGAQLRAAPWQETVECPRCGVRWPRRSWLWISRVP